MDSGDFGEDIREKLEPLGCRYVIKGKGYPNLVKRVTDPSIAFITSAAGCETTELVAALNAWKEEGRFVVSRALGDEKDRKQYAFLEMDHEKWCKMEEIMLMLSEFRRNHHPSDGRMLAKFFRMESRHRISSHTMLAKTNPNK